MRILSKQNRYIILVDNRNIPQINNTVNTIICIIKALFCTLPTFIYLFKRNKSIISQINDQIGRDSKGKYKIFANKSAIKLFIKHKNYFVKYFFKFSFAYANSYNCIANTNYLNSTAIYYTSSSVIYRSLFSVLYV